MKRRVLHTFSIVAFIAVLLAPAQGAFAAGSEFIGGFATDANVTWYYTPRLITNPSSPGPEVAFNQASGNPGLFLGKHDCYQGGGGPIYKQAIGSWQPVAYTATPMTFCLFTFSNSGPGSFNGNLAWD